ncbi:sulfate adenylyltransferase subunit CysN [Brevundimonas sp.]|uniref:sulfate adenylyltransferase subunit CysN n=1 Tax=Brevundimonas sp. TaxID=1871086 RepID=UPI0022CB60C2|nr:sulfate adenylyltransferase subunit CysN [Brevundimonas sp.]MCZ8194954.1 sulfate adenylyltransferase subunit CysN [Brevundimonas sp.]
MAPAEETAGAIAADVEAWLEAHRRKGLLRVLTCGSVDDGKSTLIGRLLYDARAIFDDHLATLEADSARVGTQGGDIDFALLVDGLAAEREQGITIDVAYRFFATERRKFIVADCPGHEQYTRNMVTGASTADAAILLVDARKGVLTQTRRHAYLVSLLGVRHLILAVNKMDLVDGAQAVFDAIVAEFTAFAAKLGRTEVHAVPLSALRGDNVLSAGAMTPWYDGPPLMTLLERLPVGDDLAAGPFRLPVQWVNRPGPDFRGFAGLIAAGSVAPGDAVKVLPGGAVSRVARLVTADGDLDRAVAGQSVTLTLTDEIEVSRGAVLAAADAPLEVADQFEATLVWMDEEPLLPGRPYLIKLGTRQAGVQVTDLKHRVNVNTLEPQPATRLELNAIAVAKLSLDAPVAFAPYPENRDLGGFILIDRISNRTVGAGMIRFALRRAHNLHWQALSVDKAARAALKRQTGVVVWFTGLSGAGKSTIADLVEKRLHALGRHTYLLDGDNVRHGLNRDLGFTDEDRVENIRRVAEVARLMVDAGLIVMVSFISPFRAERRLARDLMGPGEFVEVHVDTPLAVAEQRDVKGLYRKARDGQLKNFTGIDSPYEPPEAAEIVIDTTRESPEAAAERIVARLEARDER